MLNNKQNTLKIKNHSVIQTFCKKETFNKKICLSLQWTSSTSVRRCVL